MQGNRNKEISYDTKSHIANEWWCQDSTWGRMTPELLTTGWYYLTNLICKIGWVMNKIALCYWHGFNRLWEDQGPDDPPWPGVRKEHSSHLGAMGQQGGWASTTGLKGHENITAKGATTRERPESRRGLHLSPLMCLWGLIHKSGVGGVGRDWVPAYVDVYDGGGRELRAVRL